jgi:primosomal protein N' (replication factor Y)
MAKEGRQQSLFDAEPAPWELDAADERTIATVVLPTGPAGPFDYTVPEEFSDAAFPERLLEAGRRVRVPFGRGNRSVVGYCVASSVGAATGRRLKAIAGVVDSQRLLSPAMIRLTRWMADYYLCPWGQVLEAVVPAGVRGMAGTRQVKLLSPTAAGRAADVKSLRSAQQRAALELLLASERPLTTAAVAERVGCTEAPVRALVKQGLAAAKIARVPSGSLPLEGRAGEGVAPVPGSSPLPNPPPQGEGTGGNAKGGIRLESKLTLNEDQQAALGSIINAIDAREARGIVLHGVTGSGKTEVYLQAIERVASFGRQAIVLVPEISLTPQTVRRFKARFDSVAVLHSHLTNVERHEHWQRIAAGDVQVIVGARSAIFAPTPHLGLVVIDEEHETTFKQDQAPRYHARDVAWQRAQAEGIPLVLGSATPSLESWQRSATGEFERLSLPRRVMNRPLPDAVTVDLRDAAHTRFSRGAISRPLHQAMTAALRDGGQVMLLLNRRGFSTHIQCPACGYVVKCARCDLSLTFHRQRNLLLCHYCDYESPPPVACTDCKSPAIRYGGLGTQKLEAEVRARFPDYPCARMDMDSMRKRGSHDDVLSAFHRGEFKILLGTQMIAKGLDFPNVTLVGVVNADTALHLPDFRAAERTFQLVAQVAGRTGRGERGGRVLVQTLSPEHPAIAAAVRHDYPQFAAHELAIRQAGGYPPFGSMLRLVVRGEREPIARETAAELAKRVRRTVADQASIRVVGPGVAPIERLRGEFRFHLQLLGLDAAALQATVREATAGFAAPKGVLWTADVDPWDMQ